MTHIQTRYVDYAVGAALTAATSAWTLWVMRQPAFPFEDAAMLMRYSDHLARGAGITWNIGEPPVDGATDFLYMLVVAGLARAGLAVDAAAQVVAGVSHVVTVPVLYFGLRQLHRSRIWLAALSAGYFGFGPGLALVAAYFGTPMFALLSAASCLSAVHVARNRNPTWMAAVAFALLTLTMALIRPEGVALAGLLLLGVLVAAPGHGRRTVAAFVATFLTLGGAYFVWHWVYFGHPLPNPFYKKGGGKLYYRSLYESITNVWSTGGPLLIFHALALFVPGMARTALASLIPVVGFTAIWILLSEEMNVFGRFQYALLPIILISWVPLAEELQERFGIPNLRSLRRSQRTLLAAAGVVMCGFILVNVRRNYPTRVPNYTGLHDAAQLIRPYRDRGYTVAVTEAGLLPLYSGWKAIDTWGLNDAHIAHAKGIDEAYLESRRPELIVFHAYSSPLTPGERGKKDPWSKMILVLKNYVEKHEYQRIAAFGRSAFDAHWYYVRRDFPDSAAIAAAIDDMQYDWLGPCVDFDDHADAPLQMAPR